MMKWPWVITGICWVFRVNMRLLYWKNLTKKELPKKSERRENALNNETQLISNGEVRNISTKMLDVPKMILIGSTARNSGKTTLALSIIKKYKNKAPIYAIKVTTIAVKNGGCIHGGDGCGVCSRMQSDFEITKEESKAGIKDTSMLLAGGAKMVYWLKTLKDHIGEGIAAVLAEIPEEALIICESNSLRKVVKPGIFIMVKNTDDDQIKKSAQEVFDQANIVFENNFDGGFESVMNEIEQKIIQKSLL